MPDTITAEEWLSELQAVGMTADASDGWLTVQEIAEGLGRSTRWTQLALQKIGRAGRLECIRRATRSIDGRPIVIPAYRIKPEPKPTRKRR